MVVESSIIVAASEDIELVESTIRAALGGAYPMELVDGVGWVGTHDVGKMLARSGIARGHLKQRS